MVFHGYWPAAKREDVGGSASTPSADRCTCPGGILFQQVVLDRAGICFRSAPASSPARCTSTTDRRRRVDRHRGGDARQLWIPSNRISMSRNDRSPRRRFAHLAVGRVVVRIVADLRRPGRTLPTSPSCPATAGRWYRLVRFLRRRETGILPHRPTASSGTYPPAPRAKRTPPAVRRGPEAG